jgi:SAM-dependent methyltransferase
MTQTRDELWSFWRSPDPSNQPEGYRDAPERTAFLLELVERHVAKDAAILELGCNVGRNLNALALAGYTDLTGVEINRDAVALLRKTYPALDGATIRAIPIEQAVKPFRDQAFGLVYTMAVLEHLHPDSEFVFRHMARIGRKVIVIEDEFGVSNRHFPRNYGEVFRDLGMLEVGTQSCANVPGLGPDFMARVFVQ